MTIRVGTRVNFGYDLNAARDRKERKADRSQREADRIEDREFRREDREFRRADRERLSEERNYQIQQRNEKREMMRYPDAWIMIANDNEAGGIALLNENAEEGAGVVSADYDAKNRIATIHPEQGEKFTLSWDQIKVPLAAADNAKYRAVAAALASGKVGVNPVTGEEWRSPADIGKLENITNRDTKDKDAVSRQRKLDKIEDDRKVARDKAKDALFDYVSGRDKDGNLINPVPDAARVKELRNRLRDQSTPLEDISDDKKYTEHLKLRIKREELELEEAKAAGVGNKGLYDNEAKKASDLRRRDEGITAFKKRLGEHNRDVEVRKEMARPPEGMAQRLAFQGAGSGIRLSASEMRETLDNAPAMNRGLPNAPLSRDGKQGATNAPAIGPASRRMRVAGGAPVEGATAQLPSDGPQQSTAASTSITGPASVPNLKTRQALIDRYKKRYQGASREEIEKAIEKSVGENRGRQVR